MSIRKLWLPFLLGTLLTALLFMLGVGFSKGGNVTFSIIFFPYFSLLGAALPNVSTGIPIVIGYIGYILFFIQYPIYGIILGQALGDRRFYKQLLILLALHILIAVVCLAIYRTSKV